MLGGLGILKIASKRWPRLSSTQFSMKPTSALADGPTMPIGPNPNMGVVLSLPSPEGWTPSPPVGTPEPHTRSSPTTQEETVPFGAAENPQSIETCMYP